MEKSEIKATLFLNFELNIDDSESSYLKGASNVLPLFYIHLKPEKIL